jgi:DNA polymerase I-like protein with 3'-5' exonuclease and polymerase domains
VGEEVIEDEKEKDFHKLSAAKRFGVPVEKVTPEQRRAAKSANYFDMYHDPESFNKFFQSL